MTTWGPIRGRRRRNEAWSPPEDEPTYGDLLQSAAERLERAREDRDRAIRAARAARIPLRDIAESTSLSVARVKQIGPPQAGGQKSLDPIIELDLITARTANDEVRGIDEVAPWLEKFKSERDFAQSTPERSAGLNYDINHHMLDLDPETPWVAVYNSGSKEIAAWRSGEPNTPIVESDADDNWNPLSASGPCLVLGHLPSWAVVEVGVDRAARQAAHRLGGLAWLYGRIRLLNAVFKSLTDVSDRLIDWQSPLSEYYRSLPESER